MEPVQQGNDLLHSEAEARSERRAKVSQQPPRPEPTQGLDDEPLTTTLHGPPLLLARVAWVIMAATVLVLDAAGIPYAYASAKETCNA